MLIALWIIVALLVFCGWQLRGIRANQVNAMNHHKAQRVAMLDGIKGEIRKLGGPKPTR